MYNVISEWLVIEESNENTVIFDLYFVSIDFFFFSYLVELTTLKALCSTSIVYFDSGEFSVK